MSEETPIYGTTTYGGPTEIPSAITGETSPAVRFCLLPVRNTNFDLQKRFLYIGVGVLLGAFAVVREDEEIDI